MRTPDAQLADVLSRQPLRDRLVAYLRAVREDEMERLATAPTVAATRIQQGRASALADLINVLEQPTRVAAQQQSNKNGTASSKPVF
jgi:hypothetical protein